MLPFERDCDDCTPAYLQRGFQTHPSTAVLFSTLPFILTFFVVGLSVLQKLFPLLSGHGPVKDDFDLRSSSQINSRARASTRRLAALTFSATIALATVLAELILCEISNTLNPAARTLALSFSVPSLLILLIIITPLLEIQAAISAAGWKFTGARQGRFRLAWLMEAFGFTVWLLGFWWIGQGLPGAHSSKTTLHGSHNLREACLERIGVIGISLMALLSGFACVSSLWQNFGVTHPAVTEADITRKQAGLDATEELLSSKQSRLRALERKKSEAPHENFMTKVMGTIRGTADTQDRQALSLEISGLEAMRVSLRNALIILKNRQQYQERSSTTRGRVLTSLSYVFSFYCLYRIFATSIATLRRWWYPEITFAGTDPINNFLAILAKHWDPALDRLAWSRQISFLLSGVILFASFNSVLQTFHLFSRFTPSVFHHAQANFALLVSQISATYVISSALLLRSNLPQELSSVISEALGAPLEPIFVDRWFEGWFLAASALTAAGIFIGKKFSGGEEWDDDDEGALEMGKRS